jgi:phage N-6-adenine-methyltransferase
MAFPNTSVNERWGTPQNLFDILNQEFRFRIDAAADETNHKCKFWFGPGSKLNPDALDTDHWARTSGTIIARQTGLFGSDGAPMDPYIRHGDGVWCNPPYTKSGGGILPWMKRGRATAQAGAICVMLIYARTDTKAWQDIVHPFADEVRLIEGRLKFEPPGDYTGKATTAGAPSAIVIFQPETAHLGRIGGAQYRTWKYQDNG